MNTSIQWFPSFAFSVDFSLINIPITICIFFSKWSPFTMTLGHIFILMPKTFCYLLRVTFLTKLMIIFKKNCVTNTLLKTQKDVNIALQLNRKLDDLFILLWIFSFFLHSIFLDRNFYWINTWYCSTETYFFIFSWLETIILLHAGHIVFPIFFQWMRNLWQQPWDVSFSSKHFTYCSWPDLHNTNLFYDLV